MVTPPARRVTLVADQALGYFRTGGLGTATTFLALALGRMGHDVEILYFGELPTGDVDPEWTRLYETAGVRIRPLEPVKTSVELGTSIACERSKLLCGPARPTS